MGSVHNGYSLLFHYPLFPCSTVGPFHGLKFLLGKSAPMRHPPQDEFTSGRICSAHRGLSTACRGISAPAHRAPPPPIFFSRLSVHTAVSYSLFVPFPALCSAFFFLFLKYIFPEPPPPWLRGSVASCGGFFVTSCVQHRAAPDLF